MAKRKRLYWRLILFIIFIFLIFWNEDLLEEWASYVQKYYFSVFQNILNFSQNVKEFLSIFDNLQREKEYWQKKAEELYKENLSLKISLENLKRFNEFSWIKDFKIKNYVLIPAMIIGRGPVDWDLNFRIDKGKKDGIRENMPVIFMDQLIGKIKYVGYNFSEVQTIYNPSFSVGVTIYETKDQGVIKGSLEYMELSYLFSDSGIKNGYQVITSGIDNEIPYGLKVGYIIEVSKNPTYFLPKVKVLPYLDFSKLKGVVICKMQ